jgi:putative transposase
MRKPRVLSENATYHVVARTNKGEFTLHADSIKEMFLTTTKRAKSKYRFSLINLCIMSNHIHFMIIPARGESLSRIMQWILGVFALSLNKLFGQIGHVWYDRFKSRIIDGLQQFLHAFQYIADNPVKAEMTRRPHDYPYNGVCLIRCGELSLLDDPGSVIRLQLPGYCEALMLPRA